MMDYHDIGSRVKRLNPIWALGTGMDVGELSPYIRTVCLNILLEIFQREVRDDNRRTISDMESITDAVIRNLKLKTIKERNERIVEGLIWSGDPRYLSSFKAPFFNEETGQWEEHIFRYLEEEEGSSIPEEQIYVYKLTEDSYEMIFMSHEILDELDIDIQSWVALQLIKSGNYRDALDRLQRLIIRVRKLTKKEERLGIEIKRNPKNINKYNQIIGKDHRRNVDNQFAEEKERYMEMEKILSKIIDAPELEDEISTLLDRINETRELHDTLAQLVIENVKTIIVIRKNYYHHLWKKPRTSFKESIWEDLILQKGFVNPDDMFQVLIKLFSPKKPLIYPLDWSLEQVVTKPMVDIDTEDDRNDGGEELLTIPSIDWKPTAELWRSVFLQLLNEGTVNAESIFSDEETRLQWLQNKHAVELWNQFVNSTLLVSKQDLLNSSDQRIRLLKELIHIDKRFEELLNIPIFTEFIEGDYVQFKLKDTRGLIMTNYRILLKGGVPNHA
ncbi:TPA: hypothetical protein QC443_003810 [Bacillus cereus]|nr:hypothetical protein [Bacillus cereus]MBL3878146.1 hypothetical protein [Bacillus cereus]BCD05074.1 hypothetical protein BC30052_2129 [Bacillus cereus]HDR7981504.1 hypothetical protein [Bacillus cereus]HDR8077547.1 hypothetical protein [Bacillus cereus]HDR8208417.1 hypothetical protein [Bacillus cereus]